MTRLDTSLLGSAASKQAKPVRGVCANNSNNGISSNSNSSGSSSGSSSSGSASGNLIGNGIGSGNTCRVKGMSAGGTGRCRINSTAIGTAIKNIATNSNNNRTHGGCFTIKNSEVMLGRKATKRVVGDKVLHPSIASSTTRGTKLGTKTSVANEFIAGALSANGSAYKNNNNTNNDNSNNNDNIANCENTLQLPDASSATFLSTNVSVVSLTSSSSASPACASKAALLPSRLDVSTLNPNSYIFNLQSIDLYQAIRAQLTRRSDGNCPTIRRLINSYNQKISSERALNEVPVSADSLGAISRCPPSTSNIEEYLRSYFRTTPEHTSILHDSYSSKIVQNEEVDRYHVYEPKRYDKFYEYRDIALIGKALKDKAIKLAQRHSPPPNSVRDDAQYKFAVKNAKNGFRVDLIVEIGCMYSDQPSYINRKQRSRLAKLITDHNLKDYKNGSVGSMNKDELVKAMDERRRYLNKQNTVAAGCSGQSEFQHALRIPRILTETEIINILEIHMSSGWEHYGWLNNTTSNKGELVLRMRRRKQWVDGELANIIEESNHL